MPSCYLNDDCSNLMECPITPMSLQMTRYAICRPRIETYLFVRNSVIDTLFGSAKLKSDRTGALKWYGIQGYAIYKT